jgi:NADPH2:quinone reductase
VRAIQIAELGGPDAVRLVDAPDPPQTHPMTPGQGVVIGVHAAAVSFPDVLQSRGLYQYKPDLPFVPGAEVAGEVLSASADSGFEVGQRVAGLSFIGGMAERVVAPPFLCAALRDTMDYAQGAALIMNYHTVLFALRLRGRLAAGEKVLVHGAAGGVGTAGLQVARCLGAETIAVVSSDEKERIAREAGATDVVRSDGPWREQVQEHHGGVDVVLDPVGGDRFTDSLRCLNEGGRLLVVGFTGGPIPEVRVNRLLLKNIEVVGAGWGAYAMSKPDLCRQMSAELDEMIAVGGVAPIVGARFPLAEAGAAMRLIEGRGALGKVVLEL